MTETATKETGAAGKPKAHGLFKLTTGVQQAYLKTGLLGFAGSGKSYTSALIARGVCEKIRSKKTVPPVFFLDTEAGSDFLAPRFKEWGILFYVSRSRAFVDLLSSVEEAERQGAILIIDSVTHFWTELMASYMKRLNRKRLLFQDWGPIKEEWRRFTDAYLNSRVHIIMCGRAGYEYDYFEDEAGKKQLEKTGTKMKAESDMGYEPSLLIEMVRERRENKTGEIEGRLWDHTAVVLKDRTTLVEGKRFRNPTFAEFEPVFNFLNIGGDHVAVDTTRESTALFDPQSDENWQAKKKRAQIALEEIEAEIISAIPGRNADEVRAKSDILQEVFGTRSWTAVQEQSLEALKAGLGKIEDWAKKIKTGEVKIAKTTKEK